MRRMAFTVMIALAWLVAMSQPASAHSVSGVGANNWKTVITGISPRVAGLSLKVVEGGSRLVLTNRGAEITVFGYEGEPYLRVGPQGVFENVRSPATYLNCARIACSVPPQADPQSPPQWKRISAGTTARWHDHRIHWMGSRVPPQVAQAPNQVHVEGPWTINLQQGLTPIAVTGNYTWIPAPAAWPWLIVALVLLVLTVVTCAIGAWGPPLAVAVLLLTINDIYHAVAIAFYWSGDLATRAGKFFTGSLYSIIGWSLGLVAVWLLLRRRVDGLYAAVFAGVSAALFTGLLDFMVLARSQAPFAGPVTVDRLTVAVSLGLGLGVALGALVAIRRTPRGSYDDDYDLEGPAQPA